MKINSARSPCCTLKGKLNLTDGEYRAALVHIGGVTGSTELDRDVFEAFMGFFEWMGRPGPW